VYSIFDNTTDRSGTAWSGGGIDGVHETIDTSLLATFSYKYDGTILYQDIIITDIAETHKEGEGRLDVFGDAFVSMATGAEPIGIQLTGLLLRVKEHDSRADFIDVYYGKLRGSAVTVAQDQIKFSLKQSVVFTLFIQSIAIREMPEKPDFTHISFTGVAADYRIVPISVASSPNTPPKIIMGTDTQETSEGGQQ
jgi:hypothetical protein